MAGREEKLNEIISKILLLRADQLDDSIRRKDYEPWDSMAHLVLISEVENEFGVFFTDDEVVEIWTLADLRRVLATKF